MSAGPVTAILSALPAEQAGLAAALDPAYPISRTTHAGRVFQQGTLHGQVVVLALSGIGKVAAATTATALVERFHATRIVFTGVAGGLGQGVAVGDVVVARDFVQHDMDASPLFPRWEVPGYGRTRWECDAALTSRLEAAADACLQRMAAPRRHTGLIASGDVFVGSATAARTLRQGLSEAGHDVLAVEMEGAAVAQVCADYGVPFAAMRTISDRADDTAHVDFSRFVTEVASRYADEIIGEFMQSL